jgi:translation initiation factor IF-2
MRVYELARVLGVSSRELLDRLHADGEWATSHMSLVPDPRVRQLITSLHDDPDADPSLPGFRRDEQAINTSPLKPTPSQTFARSFVEAVPWFVLAPKAWAGTVDIRTKLVG